MIKKTGTIILILFAFSLFIPINSFASKLDDLIKKGNELYQKAQYKEAVKFYKQVLNKGYESSGLYYNLGNAYYKEGKLGYAILNYEKGLKLNPNNDDLNYNLKIAQAHTIDKIKEVPQIFIVRWWNIFLTALTVNGWAAVVIGFYILFLVFIGAYFLSRKRKIIKFAFYFGGLDLIVLIFSISLLIARINYDANNEFGILLKPVVTVKQSPDLKSDNAFVIHEGVKFKVEDQLNNWTKIQLSDGKIGWLPRNTFGAI